MLRSVTCKLIVTTRCHSRRLHYRKPVCSIFRVPSAASARADLSLLSPRYRFFAAFQPHPLRSISRSLSITVTITITITTNNIAITHPQRGYLQLRLQRLHLLLFFSHRLCSMLVFLLAMTFLRLKRLRQCEAGGSKGNAGCSAKSNRFGVLFAKQAVTLIACCSAAVDVSTTLKFASICRNVSAEILSNNGEEQLLKWG
jgi:hypothetical protein